MPELEPGWLWAIGGVLLLAAEVIAPGFFLLFIGAAAIVTGLFTLLFGFGLAGQLALFAIYAILAVAVGKRWYAQPQHPDQQILNDPVGRLAGRSATVVEAVDQHGGRVRLGDGEWTARGGPAAPGDKVRIERVEGNCLYVGRPDALPPTA